MSKRDDILPTRASFFFQVQEKLKAFRSSELNASSSCFIVDDSHAKIVWLHVADFSEHGILHFRDKVHLFKYYAVKVSLIFSITQIKPISSYFYHCYFHIQHNYYSKVTYSH